jgi:hypothetical protein
LRKYEQIFKDSDYTKFKHILSMVLKDVMVDPDEPEKKSKINRKGTKVGKK